MKKLVNLKGAKALNRKEQKEIFGGEPPIPHGDGQGGSGGGGGAPCSACSVSSDCNSGVCMTSSGDCQHLPCGCLSYKHCL
ncbi:MAG: hypothetical protein L3J20_07485 [Flavobacteriaceae bacterium]|nr:hypothetical protein [Flavobacteriaceae bacterium]